MKKLWLGLILIPFASFSASIADMQRECEKLFDKFPDMASCVTKKVKADDFIYSSPQARTYVATATNLSAKVRRGEMYDDEAALALQEKYNQLNSEYVNQVQSAQDPVGTYLKKRLDNAGKIVVDVHNK
ncbi:hypothetical protein EGT71_19595 [Atlantibacter subterranea]|uniref:Uncharacterized protein n=1 Tax=Atlantibacter subterraneus TaxID=255519 RepID=A0A427URZ5_9ENTR|nr:hypothetical protein [Atlantibacter subterranea]RSB60331.1 hypothetical protein EGK67_18035 [Atlantibacter subterranea]RSE02473.1 hypothetical protein EGT84_19030 [Atlantibacter subterranea]RSE22984.1 hypothetical protein EGT71_19595 [Atlantibacter subterranea]